MQEATYTLSRFRPMVAPAALTYREVLPLTPEFTMNQFVLGALTIAATLGGYAAPAAARVDAQVSINVGPPAARTEVVPRARPGQQWNAGYWDVRRGRHVWVPGSWVRAQPGYRYIQPEWVAHNGRWVLVRGYWTEARGRGYGDRDRDGIPNRYDRDRDDDGVRNRNDRDRDGDGVPNRRDARPDNPNRW
jgi:hypothetical protein